MQEEKPPMHADGRRGVLRAATVRERFRTLRSRAMRTVFGLLLATLTLGTSAQDLITAAEVQWHIEALELPDADAAQVEELAGRANAEAAALETVRSELGAWLNTLSGGSMGRMVSLIPNGIGVHYLDGQHATIAKEAIKAHLAEQYFEKLAELSGDAAAAEGLHNAHIVAHFGDVNNIRPEKLRDILDNVLKDDDDAARPQIEAALAQHEKNLAAIYQEWKHAELHDVADRAQAWTERNFDAYLEASLRYYMGRIHAREEVGRAGNQILTSLAGEARAKFARDLRRMLYPPTLSNLMDGFDKAMGRIDLPEAARQALVDRRDRFFADHDARIDAIMGEQDSHYNRERVRRVAEASARNAFYGERFPPEFVVSPEEHNARTRDRMKLDLAFREDVQAILREHGAIDPNERLQVMSLPLAADVPAQTDPTWRFYHSNPVFSRPDLERMLDACRAADDQRTLARAIYDDYRREVHEKAVELGVTVAELDQKREQFKRENPDAAQGADWSAYINDYGRLDAAWSAALTEFDVALLEDMRGLFEESQQAALERAVFGVHWERLNQFLRSGNMGGEERHLLIVVEEAFADGEVARECGPILLHYRDEMMATILEVRGRLEALEMESREARERRQSEGGEPDEGPSREYEEWVALFQKPGELNRRYRDLLLVAANEHDRDVLQRAFDKEVHPELFVASPIDLLARELEELEAGEGGGVDPDRLAIAATILDNARAQYDRNTQSLMAAKKEWSGEGAQDKWQRWQEDHPPPDPTRPQLDRVGPMDHLWDQRLDISKNACAGVARLFPAPEQAELPAGVRLLLMWSASNY